MLLNSWKYLLIYYIVFYVQVAVVLAFNRLNPKNLPESYITRGDGVNELPCNSWAEIEPGASVRIASPNFPNKYPSSEYCLRTLVATKEDSKLHFSCKTFDLASDSASPCRTSNDHLKIWENNHRKSKSYCGSDGPNLIKTLGTILNIAFYTNNKDAYQGFDCTVTAINKHPGPRLEREPGLEFRSEPRPERRPEMRPERVSEPEPEPMVSPRNKISRRIGVIYPQSCSCGHSNLPLMNDQKEVNASQFSVGVHEHPWLAIVKVFKSANDICSASLINDKYLLTSATCVSGTTEEFIKVVLGEHNLLSRSETNQTQDYLVEDITIHPAFNRATFENDIALIELKSTIDFTLYSGIKPVCLPVQPVRLEAIRGKIVGWQSFPWAPEMEHDPQQVSVSVMPRQECNSTLSSFNVDKSMICVTNSLVGTCKSDVGGPLIVLEEDRFYLLGIGSVVQDCTNGDIPAVYTDVREYLDWIASNTHNANTCLK